MPHSNWMQTILPSALIVLIVGALLFRRANTPPSVSPHETVSSQNTTSHGEIHPTTSPNASPTTTTLTRAAVETAEQKHEAPADVLADDLTEEWEHENTRNIVSGRVPPGSVEVEHRDPVDQLIVEKRFDEAKILLLARLKATPDSRDDLIRLGKVYIALKETSHAIQTLSKVLKLDPEDPLALKLIQLATKDSNANYAYTDSNRLQTQLPPLDQNIAGPKPNPLDQPGMPPFGDPEKLESVLGQINPARTRAEDNRSKVHRQWKTPVSPRRPLSGGSGVGGVGNGVGGGRNHRQRK